MLGANGEIAFNFLILVSLFGGISGVPGGINEQKETLLKNPVGNNSRGTSDKTSITTVVTITEDDKKTCDHEARKYFKRNFARNETLEEGRNKNGSLQAHRSRKVRHPRRPHSTKSILQCYECYASASANSDYCYSGQSLAIVSCNYGYAKCVTEINPQFIRRGCMLPEKLNLTFVCNCPLCNDKSSSDYTYFKYDKYDDWLFDNQRLTKPVKRMNLLCKICNTKGTKIAANRCRNGRDVDSIKCGNNQLCYTNIDDSINFVARGCSSAPAFNSFHSLCDGELCNSNKMAKLGWDGVYLYPELDEKSQTRRAMKRLTSLEEFADKSRSYQIHNNLFLISVPYFLNIVL